MSKFIDADWLMRALNVFRDKEHGNEHFLLGIETAKELLNSAPVADAKPVTHGKWIGGYYNAGDNYYYTVPRCSRYGYGDGHVGCSNYCPHCGADMRGSLK